MLADHGGSFHVELRIKLERIREIDVPAGEGEIIAAESHLAAEQVDVSQQNGAVPCAAEPDVAVNIELRARPLNARAGAGVPRDIERKVAQEW